MDNLIPICQFVLNQLSFGVSISESNLCNALIIAHVQAAKEARYDKEAVMKFFRMVCIIALSIFIYLYNCPFAALLLVYVGLLCVALPEITCLLSVDQEKIFFRRDACLKSMVYFSYT